MTCEYMITSFAEGAMTATMEDALDAHAVQGWSVVCALPTMGEGQFHRFLLARKKPGKRKPEPAKEKLRPVYWVLARLTDEGYREYLGPSGWWRKKLTPEAKVFGKETDVKKYVRMHHAGENLTRYVAEAVYQKAGA